MVTRKCTHRCTWFVCLSCIWWHPLYSSPLVSCYQASWASCLLLYSVSLFLSSVVTNYRPWRHITQCYMDLSGCRAPALFRLFPIRQAASAGPQPAREWKSLAHVIFGKCRVHRNPGARSPVSARHPRPAITKERWRNCSAPKCREEMMHEKKSVAKKQNSEILNTVKRKQFLPFWLFTLPEENLSVLQFVAHFLEQHKQSHVWYDRKW